MTLHLILPAQAEGTTPLAVDRLLELDGAFTTHGAWSGVEELVECAYDDCLAEDRRDLIDQHNYALHRVLVRQRPTIALKYASLTDIARGAEKTRNFPLDRAYRLVNSLVKFINQWKAWKGPGESWAIVVRNFDRSQHLARRFFLELGRLGHVNDLLVYGESRTELAWDLETRRGTSLLSVAEAPLTRLSQALSIEPMHAEGTLTRCLRETPTLEAAKLAAQAMCLYNHYGYYYESSAFAEVVRPFLNELTGDDEALLWSYIGNIYQGMITTGQEDRALRWLLDFARPQLKLPVNQAKLAYVLSITYLRHLKPAQVEKAETYMLAAVAHTEAARTEMPFHDYAFLKVFIDNGLAFVRVRQGRQAEALDLCNAGFTFLTEALGDARHRLHRSVLLYNSAQVHMALGRQEDALRSYQTAIAMDPYYSEYYNDVGNILQKREDYAGALSAYAKAIEYSAPYMEVYFNKGICHSHLGHWDEALACFEEALALEPLHAEIHLLRAEVYDQLGRTREALADYDAVIAKDPESVSARVNRATLHFSAGDFAEALADMNAALVREPHCGSHYENRSEIYRALMARDLVQAERFQLQ